MSAVDNSRWWRGNRRLLTRSTFFLLFVLAPPLDLLRYDLTLGHFILFGQPWTLGIDPFAAGEIGAGEAFVNLLLRALLPLLLVAGLLLGIAWRYGRLYCGWFCPHFSVVETVNALMLRASGKPTLWERRPLPGRHADRRFWPVTLLVALAFAFIWALSLLSYLLPPFELYHNLYHGTLSTNQGRFLAIATTVFTLEFLFARHLFCRFGCAVGLFQSLAWMANRKAMVVGFDTARAAACKSCNNACDNACPMRLHPRTVKRGMFTCTECAECISACTQVQGGRPEDSLLQWVDQACALPVVTGRPADGPGGCFGLDRGAAGSTRGGCGRPCSGCG
jgi:polyferredoxin